MHSKTLLPSESFHQREVQQNDAQRERNFRIRRHLSVDDTEQSSQNTEANQVMCVVRLIYGVQPGIRKSASEAGSSSVVMFPLIFVGRPALRGVTASWLGHAEGSKW